MNDRPQIVKCKGCGKDRWWVNDEVSPPLCIDCTDRERRLPAPISEEGTRG